MLPCWVVHVVKLLEINVAWGVAIVGKDRVACLLGKLCLLSSAPEVLSPQGQNGMNLMSGAEAREFGLRSASLQARLCAL